jgi:hypothetical protein
MAGLRRSSRTTSRQRPCSFPRRSRTPTARNPQATWSRMLGWFSGKMPVWTVQIPPCSAEVTTAVSRARPMPWPWASGAR